METISIEQVQTFFTDYKKLEDDHADWKKRVDQLLVDRAQLLESLKQQNYLLDEINGAGSLMTPESCQKKSEIIIASNQIKRKLKAFQGQNKKLNAESDTLAARYKTSGNERERIKNIMVAIINLFNEAR